ncbi:hypothetical protein Pint_08756 [Pistacia integerrima]|uniref:Uncharacterized protein n=1 Tax=Pistacia integerrima TaxID=434235 RepID=A0ACC0XYG6_9ROSI|nr:hypothetical protein Pint_08756 [Pistacia integerrima]
MAFSALKVLLLVISMILTVKARVDQASFHPITSESLALPWTMAMYDELGEHEEHEYDGEIDRRSLYRKHYYISSYYTHNCHRARGPANPYTRGCSAITHCRR